MERRSTLKSSRLALTTSNRPCTSPPPPPPPPPQVQSDGAASDGGGTNKKGKGAKKDNKKRGGGGGGGNRGGAGKNKKETPTAGLLELRRTPESPAVLVGRNNLQNERITFSLARAHELWLHARGVAGAHVLLRLVRREKGVWKSMGGEGARKESVVGVREGRVFLLMDTTVGLDGHVFAFCFLYGRSLLCLSFCTLTLKFFTKFRAVLRSSELCISDAHIRQPPS